MKRRWGVYSLHIKSNCYTQFTKLGETESELGQTDFVHNVTIKHFSGTNMQLGRTDMVRVRA